MGLTLSSTGSSVCNSDFSIKKISPGDKIIAVAGNPNVGKSTIFNALTGMKQHTGNWPGKTVSNAQGYCKTKKNSYVLVDIPGTYSLFPHSPEEEIARDFICFGKVDGIIIVCDATCIERNMNLVLQTLEITKNVIVCVNLLDEAKRKGIEINLCLLSQKLGVPVIGTVAHKKESLKPLLNALDNIDTDNDKYFRISYPKAIENAIERINPIIKKSFPNTPNSRWLSLRLLEKDYKFIKKYYQNHSFSETDETDLLIVESENILKETDLSKNDMTDVIVSSLVSSAEKICENVVTYTQKGYSDKDRKTDKIVTSRRFGYPIMILGLCFIFWLTIWGANYISDFLSLIFLKIEYGLNHLLTLADCPQILKSIIIDGVYRVPAWIVSVMLPPMAIFFPLFTLLEDSGYLPRIAYNLDKPFKCCKSCGKQALTMCMGFGCNAAGVVGCRIIDSPRERLLAIITNNLVPCNGRFPAIIAIISMFFVTASGFAGSLISAFLLTAVIMTGIIATFLSTKLLSATVLKGTPSSYTLELPPYRKPQIGSVLVRSVFDRTLFILGRAVTVAVPTGVIIWLMANITIGNQTILIHCAEFLNPLAVFFGLDGIILMAFILGFPANEIVLPIIIMAYLSNGSISELGSLSEIRNILIANNWTAKTAVCTIIFSLMHWPCSTTVLTIKKETGSFKWTLFSFIFPTILGLFTCMIINFIF